MSTDLQSAIAINQSALSIRLDTTKILEDIELYLRGRKLVLSQGKNGKISAQKVAVGKPKANDLGVQSILSFVAAIINPQVVQGNFDAEQYEHYIYETHINIVTNIVVNCYNWKIDDEDIDPICDFIMAIIQPFVSRLVNNEERKSYEGSLRYGENPGQPGQQSQGRLFF